MHNSNFAPAVRNLQGMERHGMKMEKQYSFTDLIEIVKSLRSENGCPWDKVQTHESLRPCMVEEAYELLSAIRIFQETGNPENLKEEIGDVLLQAVMHSVIADEEGLFTMDDVITGISEKMIRRHPHIFSNQEITDEEQIHKNWEEIKKQEKEKQSWVVNPLREIPCELPSLTRAVKVNKKLDKLSQYKSEETQESPIPSSPQIVEHLKNCVFALENCVKQQETVDKEAACEQIRGILHEVCQLSYRLGISPEQILYDDIETVISEYECKKESKSP